MSARSVAGCAALFALAAAWFAVGITLPIGWFDEGMIVYPSWRVAQGEIPFREFRQLYGPSLFFLNGLLFHWFGDDLLVPRVSMVVIKSGIATLVYAVARSAVSRPYALTVFAITVAIWGLPIPAAVISYANYHGMAFAFLGLYCIVALPRRLGLACGLAGLCFGLGATFKQTSGAFAFIATALFLLTERTHTRSEPGPRLLALARVGRASVLVVALALFGYYLSPANTALNVSVLLPPVLLMLASLGADELRGRVPPASQVHGFQALVWLSLGALAPLLAYSVYYAAQGLFGELVFNTITVVPRAHDWLVTYPPTSPDWPLWLGIWAGAAAGVWFWGARRAEAGTTARALRMLAPLLVVGCAVALLWREVSAAQKISWLFWKRADLWHQKWWFWTSSELLELLPATAAWASGWWLLRGRREDSDRAVVLFACFAIAGSFALYPCQDTIHAFMAVPAFLPLLAVHLERLRDSATGRARQVAVAYAALLAALLALPSVSDLVGEAWRQRPEPEPFERASHIGGGNPISWDAAELLAWLDEPDNRDEEILVLTGRQIIHFLTGRRSLVQRSQFGLYLISIDTVSDWGIEQLVDEDDLVRQLAEHRPIVIDDVYNAAGENAYKRLPKVARFLEREYERVKTIGNFRTYRPKRPVR